MFTHTHPYDCLPPISRYEFQSQLVPSIFGRTAYANHHIRVGV